MGTRCGERGAGPLPGVTGTPPSDLGPERPQDKGSSATPGSRPGLREGQSGGWPVTFSETVSGTAGGGGTVTGLGPRPTHRPLDTLGSRRSEHGLCSPEAREVSASKQLDADTAAPPQPVTATLARARTRADVPGRERELAVPVCPLGGCATNGCGGKLGAGLGSGAKVRPLTAWWEAVASRPRPRADDITARAPSAAKSTPLTPNGHRHQRGTHDMLSTFSPSWGCKTVVGC